MSARLRLSGRQVVSVSLSITLASQYTLPVYTRNPMLPTPYYVTKCAMGVYITLNPFSRF